jgi:diguanylate cyclase (GGDEF)-like protein
VVRLLELVLDPGASQRDIASLIRTDPGLALEVLRLLEPSERKSRFGLHLNNALGHLNTERLRDLALKLPIRGHFEPLDAPEGAACSLDSRKHAMATATAAAALARATHYAEPETAYTAGLLASIGSLALWQLDERGMRDVQARAAHSALPGWLAAEREHFNFDHELLALTLADAWSLPYELHDVLSALYRTPEDLERMGAEGVDVHLASLVRAGFYAAHDAGFPLHTTLVLDPPPADAQRLFDAVDLSSVLEQVRDAVGRAAELSRPRARSIEAVFPTMMAAREELQRRLLEREHVLRASQSVFDVLKYSFERLGDGDPLPGVMLQTMEHMDFRRISCLELDEREARLVVKLSQAVPGETRTAEGRWVPCPAERDSLERAARIDREAHDPLHQRVLELCDVHSAVIAPLRDLESGRRMLLVADRGRAGRAPVPGEEHALGSIADQASLLVKFERMERANKQLATQDPLTGAATRRKLMERLEFLASQSERTRLPFSLLIMDLDHFKRFNDTMGHQTGDSLLQDLVRILQASVRKGDLVARYGGEEFVVLLPSCAIDRALELGEELRRIVHAYGVERLDSYRGLQVSISMGAAQWQRGEGAAALIGRADAALYEAKHAGRNRVMRAA